LAGSGNLTLSGVFTWTGGELAGGPGSGTTTTINPGVNWTVNAASSPALDQRILLNSGNGAMIGSPGSFRIPSPGVFHNLAGATLDSQSGVDGTGGVCDNQAGATFKRSVASGTTSVTSSFANAGSVVASAGTLQFTGPTPTFSTSTQLRVDGGTLILDPA